MIKKKGFTLIELLVVISVIALLMSILMPSLGKVRQMAMRIICATNLRTIALGDQVYAQESNDWHVPVLNGLSPDNVLWFQNPLFVKIVDFKGRHNEEEAMGYDALTLPEDFKCPSDRRKVGEGLLLYESSNSVEGVSYGMNGMGLYGETGWYYYMDNTPGAAHSLKVPRVVSPSQKFFFMDAVWFVVHRDGASYKLYWDEYGDCMGPWFWDTPSYRHSEGANVEFYDGHVEYLQKEKMYKYDPNAKVKIRLNNAMWLPIPGKEYLDPPR